MSNTKNRDPGPDRQPWPAVGYVRIPQLRAALGVGNSTVYLWLERGILPRPVRFGPNVVGWPVPVAHEIIATLPAKIAALKSRQTA